MTQIALIPRSIRRPLLQALRGFTPNWFGATMGTGILAIALASFGGEFHAVGESLWRLDVGLFCLFSGIYGARWLIYPREAAAMFDHPVMSMFLGCIPMGLATVVNGLVLYGHDPVLAQALWVIDALMALACGVGVPFVMATRQKHSLDRMTAVWLLPIVACEVAAASAATVAPTVADPQMKLTMIAAGYALWGCSVPAAFSVMAILMLRLILHKQAPREMAASAWLPLGPIGMGALGLVTLGSAAGNALHGTPLQPLGDIARFGGLIAALPLWGYGAWWMALAVFSTVRQARLGMSFNLGWWAYVFPLGVYSVATLKLSAGLPVPLLGAVGQALVLALAVAWSVVASATVRSLMKPTVKVDVRYIQEYSI